MGRKFPNRWLPKDIERKARHYALTHTMEYIKERLDRSTDRLKKLHELHAPDVLILVDENLRNMRLRALALKEK